MVRRTRAEAKVRLPRQVERHTGGGEHLSAGIDAGQSTPRSGRGGMDRRCVRLPPIRRGSGFCAGASYGRED